MLRSIISSSLRRNLSPSTFRCISTTRPTASWMDKVKGVFTGKKTESPPSAQSFTLLGFAEEMRKARKLGSLKQFVVGRGSEATFAQAFEKQEAVIRYLGGIDPTGEKILTSHKQEAAKQCNCTIAEVENILAKFEWAKEAQIRVENLQAEGKPVPKTMAELQKMMGKSPLDHARTNMVKGGQISRNSPCPCGSKKLYKRCCGKEEKKSI